ncbi:MAG: hypothetical protein JWL80_271, partial [Parcubacteria group bacterium]|nr:hypothetical protein [Parcubacteria group bacterium]
MKNKSLSKSLLVLGSLLTIGAGIGMTGLASAQVVTSTATPATATATDTRPARNSSMGGHIGKNGVKEQLLTGDVAAKVTAAALTAVPGGTIVRVENDADGA